MIRVLLFLFILVLMGCAGSRDRHVCDSAELIEHGADGTELRFCRRYWGGLIGPHGYLGFTSDGYGAALVGSGPVFKNPPFQDNPPSFRCIGTITLDREHNRVVVKMRRILSEQGKPERTGVHPANGTYTIGIVRQAASDGQQWFREWLTNSINEEITP